MFGRLIYKLLSLLSYTTRLDIAAWRFRQVREDFYLEFVKDIKTLTDEQKTRSKEKFSERLEVLEKRTKSRYQIVHLVYGEIRARMARGDKLSLAMKQFIPREEYALLELADDTQSGDAVQRGFELCGMSASAQRVLSSTTAGQLAYPMILLVCMYGMACLFGAVIFPQVLEIQPLEKWTSAGQWLYAFDTYCAEYWWFNTAIMILLVMGYFYGLQRWTGDVRNRCDNLPFLWRNRRDLRAALLIVSLAGLFDSGMTMSAALEKIKVNADPWLRWHVSRMLRRLKQRPEEAMRALETGIFSMLIVDKITDAERRGGFVDAIKSLGRSSLDTVIEAIRRNARRTYAMMIGFAGLVFIVIGLGSYMLTGLVGLQNMIGVSTGGF